MELLTTSTGYSLAVIMGLLLGLLGGGGSILTVPILVYYFNVPSVLATGYSLLIVGITSLIGSIDYIKKGLVNFKIAFYFSAPSLIGVLIARKSLLPLIPERLHFLALTLTKDQFILVLFAILMMTISVFIMKSKRVNDDIERTQKIQKKISPILVSVEGLIVGVITGIVGAGGGFMIVPALVLLGHISLRESIATSLIIISVKSGVGFVADLTEGLPFDWMFISIFLGFTLLGVIIGSRINNRVQTDKLRVLFGYFIAIIALIILWAELT